MNTERYMYLRKELIALHRLITRRTFLVTLPLASFLSTKQLQHYQKNPPINGFESITQTSERPYTIEFILRAVMMTGEGFTMGFRKPREDIPVMFNAIQDWIKYWIEIKHDGGYLRTPDVKELELIEKLGRFIFSAYAHYHHEKINRTLQVPNLENATLLDILRGRMMFGTDFDEPISYVSYLDQYKSDVGYRDYSSDIGSDTLSFLKGFGGGL